MTARKTPAARKAPAKKAPARNRPARPRIDAQPGPTSTPERELSPEERLTVLETNYAQLRAEHDAIRKIIEQAILAQIQQQLATNPDAQQALMQSLLGATNGTPQ